MSKEIFQNYLANAPQIALDAVSLAMLKAFALHWASGEPLTVLKAMVMLPEISTTTAHRRLKELRKAGFIDLVLDQKDNRIKYVVSTKLSDTYFAALGKAMIKAVVGEPNEN